MIIDFKQNSDEKLLSRRKYTNTQFLTLIQAHASVESKRLLLYRLLKPVVEFKL